MRQFNPQRFIVISSNLFCCQNEVAHESPPAKMDGNLGTSGMQL